MEWRGEPIVSEGVRERAFVVTRDGDGITGTVWTHEDQAGPAPLVLMGHGALVDHRHAGNVAMARRFARDHHVASAAIDAIGHGERGPIRDGGDGVVPAAFFELWKQPDTLDRTVADWRATLDALVGDGIADAERIGYRGLSMGTMLGLPFVAGEPRIRAAVLGACGLAGPYAQSGGFVARHRADAPRIGCATLFMMKWDDEVFHRDGCLELFGLIGSPDKRLCAYPGGHALYPAEAEDAAREFLAGRLAG